MECLNDSSFQDVSVFLQEFKAPDILLGVIAKSRNPRLTVSHFTVLTPLPAEMYIRFLFALPVASFDYSKLLLQEICVGILGNMACFHETCVSLSQNSDLGYVCRSNVMQCHILYFLINCSSLSVHPEINKLS